MLVAGLLALALSAPAAAGAHAPDVSGVAAAQRACGDLIGEPVDAVTVSWTSRRRPAALSCSRMRAIALRFARRCSTATGATCRAASDVTCVAGTRRHSGRRPVTCRRDPTGSLRFALAPTLVAVGDIACPPGEPATASACRQAATANLAGFLDPAAVAILGDIQYHTGTLADFRGSYALSWGRLLSRTRPAPGNHEYATPGASGYFAYFGARAGTPGQGWYASDLGDWRLLALNSNCADIGGCGPGSPQYEWLRGELAARPRACTLAYWHHPRFSTGPHGDAPETAALWSLANAAGVDIVASGHEHHYARYTPQDDVGRPDLAGPRQFVVGTGGRSLYPFAKPARPAERFRDATHFGVLELRLRRRGYDWRFVAENLEVIDAGSDSCR